MRTSYKILTLFLCTTTLWIPQLVYAQSQPSLTVVNPIRGPQLGLEKANIPESVNAQWSITKEASISATWLWQYSALKDPALTHIAKGMQNQEHGLFLEIDQNSAQNAGVQYRGKVAWYHSDGLLLTSYDLSERQKLIDLFFKQFKQNFGYYPTSVGAWWVGAQPIQYMKEKYGITAVLQCADQFSTDAYSIWGTPWSIPYISSKTNAAIIAKNRSSSSNVLIMQWAPRDPLRGYGSDTESSTFSAQDYRLKSYDIRYFEYLKNIYAKHTNDQFVFGLEAGLPAEAYATQYKEQLLIAKQWEKEALIKIDTMKGFAAQFTKNKSVLPPTSHFLTKDFSSNDQSFWHHTPDYRIALHKTGDQVAIIDLRDYTNTREEDFSTIPNTNKLLRIDTHALIDSIRKPETKVVLGEYKYPLQVVEKDATITIHAGNIMLLTLTPHSIQYRYNNKVIEKTFSHSTNTSSYITTQYILNILQESQTVHNNFKAHMQSLSQGKKGALKAAAELYILVGTGITILMLAHLKMKKLLTQLAVFVCITITGYILTQTITTKDITIPSFEIEAFNFINKNKQEVVFLHDPQTKYHQNKPLLYESYHFAQIITHKRWQILTREKGKSLQLPPLHNKVVLVPRYLGAEIYPEEVEKYMVQKIFDNAQIAVYKQTSK